MLKNVTAGRMKKVRRNKNIIMVQLLLDDQLL